MHSLWRESPDHRRYLIVDKAKIILASKSPRRASLLSLLGIPFESISVDAHEVSLNTPHDTVTENARIKAKKASALYPNTPVLTGDTVVDLEGKQIEKPSDINHAREILIRLSSKTHRVVSGVAMSFGNQAIEIRTAVSMVEFVELTDHDIDKYLHHVNVTDKAGAYGIQEYGYRLARSIKGELSNVMGLPLTVTFELIRLAFEKGFV